MGPEDMGSDEEDMQDDVHGLWDVFVLVYSSVGPEDMGSDEEDMQDYVHFMLDYTCIGYEVTVLCSATLSRTLKLNTLTKRAYTIRLASGPRYSMDW